MKTHVTYDAGCGIWEVEPLDNSLEWQKKEFQGTEKECTEEAQRQMSSMQPHYLGAKYGSIWDY